MRTGKKINWYPGHMRKTSKNLLKIINQIDIVLELVDARAPNSTRNSFFQQHFKNKNYILVYMKADLTDLNKIKLSNNSVLVSINNHRSINNLIKKIVFLSKGLQKKVLVIGIPNVGKSSLINAICKKKVAKSANQPGITKNFQWFNYKNKFYLLDTPGVLPIKYDNELSNYNVAILNGIKDKLIPVIDLSNYAYNYIIKYYPDLYLKRYLKIENNSNNSFQHISKLRGIKNDKSANFELSRMVFLNDIKKGKLGKIFFEIT